MTLNSTRMAWLPSAANNITTGHARTGGVKHQIESAHPAQQKEFNALNRDVVARGRVPGVIPVEATKRPAADITPPPLRDLFGYRWAFRCSAEASSDTILGHGWANNGYSATEIDPQARCASWRRAAG